MKYFPQEVPAAQLHIVYCKTYILKYAIRFCGNEGYDIAGRISLKSQFPVDELMGGISYSAKIKSQQLSDFEEETTEK
jgi:hypothetical protein